jgi:hypothetical protein
MAEDSRFIENLKGLSDEELVKAMRHKLSEARFMAGVLKARNLKVDFEVDLNVTTLVTARVTKTL